MMSKKNILYALFIVLVLIPNYAKADVECTYTHQGVTLNYWVNASSHTATVISQYDYLAGGDPGQQPAYTNLPSNIIIPNRIYYSGHYFDVTRIWDKAFYYCSGIVSVELPSSVTYIGPSAFEGCTGLTSITIPNNVADIHNKAFKNCTSLSAIEIPSSVTSLGQSVFEGCSGLTSVIIGDGIGSIPTKTFYNCTNLSSVSISTSIHHIYNYAFANCSSLTVINIPPNVNYFGPYAFSNCSQLRCVNLMKLYAISNVADNSFENNAPTRRFVVRNIQSYNNYVSSSVWYSYQTYFSTLSDYLNLNLFPSNDTYGSVFAYISSSFPNDTICTINANANYGYHFSLWSDNVSSNPRTITITQDTTIIALFEKNIYSVSVETSSITMGHVIGGASAEYLDTVALTAIANYGYHFTHWNDGEPLNPRTILVTKDSIFTAIFDYNIYNIFVSANNTTYGTVNGFGNYNFLTNCTISATPNYGYHFTQWSDGVTNNPRTITLTRDTAFTAIFAKNVYTITANSDNTTMGSVSRSGTSEYLDTISLTATPNYGYVFSQWNDGNTDNPRTVQVTGNATYTAYFGYNQYALTVQSNNTAQGNVSGGGNYNYLSNRTITATPNYGYHFTHWNDGVTDNPRTITLTQDMSFTAYFDRNEYSVIGTTTQSERGYVTGSDSVLYLDTVVLTAIANYGYHFQQWNDNNTDNPRNIVATGNITKSAQFAYDQYTIILIVDSSIHGACTGGGNYNYLSSRTITATANYGYHFTHWSDGDTSNPRTITLTQDTSFTAYFEKNSYVVTAVSNNNTMGQATGGDTVLYLDSVTISATSNYGYHFTHWQDNNTDNPRTVQVTQNKTYTAYFDYNQYTISLDVDTAIHGNVSGSGNYNYLSNRTISATANYGYHFTNWSDGNTSNPRTITLTQDTSFTAFFERNSYVVTVVSNNNTMGQATGGDTVLYLDSITISATSNYGYHFVNWNDGNTYNPRTMQVTQDKSDTAYFNYDQFALTVQSDNTTQGNVSGGGNYNYLSNRTITATPTYGHHFTYWNDGVTENPRTITLTQDTTFTAHFAPNQYNLTVNAGEHGTATGSGTYNFGDTITIQAFPDDHYHFTRWNDGNTDNPRQYRIEENITLTAFFAIDTYTVVVVSSDIVRGMVEASGTEFVYGTPCTVTATAYTGYTFAGWSNGVTANPYTFAVISNVELTALFVEEGEEVYTVTVESADPAMGTVSGGGQALNGGTVIITAVPNEGYRFLTWNDGNTENPRTVTVTGNITYTAYFESTQGIGDVDVAEIKIFASDGRIVVQGAEGMETRVYDLMGREVVNATRNGETPVLPTGVYLVKVGTLPARKVVVMR